MSNIKTMLSNYIMCFCVTNEFDLIRLDISEHAGDCVNSKSVARTFPRVERGTPCLGESERGCRPSTHLWRAAARPASNWFPTSWELLLLPHNPPTSTYWRLCRWGRNIISTIILISVKQLIEEKTAVPPVQVLVCLMSMLTIGYITTSILV